MRGAAPPRVAAAAAAAPLLPQTRRLAVVASSSRLAAVASRPRRSSPSSVDRRSTRTTTTAALFGGGGAAAASAKAAAASCSAPALLPPDLAFTVATFAVVAVYGLAVAAPSGRLTRALLLDRPALFPSLLALAYLCLAWQAHESGALAALLDAARQCFPTPDPLKLAAVFRDGTLTAMAWLHLLAADLFAASAVLRDALATGTPVRHSLALCLMFGPLGLLSHAATRWAVGEWRRGRGGWGRVQSPSPLV